MCSNFYLMDVLKDFKIFVGVFPCNGIPIIQTDRVSFKCMIINTNKYKDEGMGHWLLVTFFVVDEVLTLCEIFDSLGGGEKSVPPHYSEYISRLRVDVKYSSIRVQALTSDFCGIFCITRFLSILGEKQTRFMKCFNLKFLERNDRKLVSLINGYLKKING